MHKVSIGLPCFNEEPFIEQTVRSILSQTEDDFELIICDNASSDRTLEILRLVTAGDPRVSIHANSENIGGARNFAKALELANCPYFMWMGAHDIVSKDYVKKLRLVLDADPQCALAYADSIFVAKDGSEIPNEPVETGVELPDESVVNRFKLLMWSLSRCDLFHGMMRREWVDGSHLTSSGMPDIVLLSSLALHGKFRRIPEIMFFRRHNREPETEEARHKRLMGQGYVAATQSVVETWTAVRGVMVDLLKAPPLSSEQRHEMRVALYQAFLERHEVPWDPVEDCSTSWDRLKMRFTSESGRDIIRRQITSRVMLKARMDNAATREKMSRELVDLLKENQRLRRELAKFKR